MFQKTLLALAVSGSVILAAGCGGSGGSGGSPSTPTSTARNDVSGPLDALQNPVSDQVLQPLAAAATGTPLAAVVTCVEQIVVGDALDVADVFAAQLDAGASSFQPSAATVQAEATNLVSDLQRLLSALNGGSGCSGSSVPTPGGFNTNPLAGTPLEPFGDTLLDTLALAQSQLTGSGGSAPSLSTLGTVLTQLQIGYQSALTNLPPEATDAPVLGASLDLINTALTDLRTTVTAAATNNPTTTGTAVTNTVTHLLDGLLVDVLPVAQLEDATGTQGAITGPIDDALAQLAAALTGGFGAPGSNLGGTALDGEIGDVLAPLTEPAAGIGSPVVLFELLEGIQGALLSGDVGGSTPPDVGSQQLDVALAEITTLLTGVSAPDSPLDPLVDTLTDLFGGLLP